MLRTISLLSVLSIALSVPTLADEPQKECCGQDEHVAQLGALAELVGEWVSADQDGDGAPDVHVTYRLTGGGSALVETLFPGQPKEMVTVYHRDGDAWVLTHYCGMGNQPRMRGGPVAGSKHKLELSFAFADATNLKPEVGCMSGLRLTYVDATHLRQEWTYTQGGERKSVTFELTRRS